MRTYTCSIPYASYDTSRFYRLEDYFDGKIDAKAVLNKYQEEGFDANQDFPGNFLWEELYQVRDPIRVGNILK